LGASRGRLCDSKAFLLFTRGDAAITMNGVKHLNHAVMSLFLGDHSAAAALLHAVRSAITATAISFL